MTKKIAVYIDDELELLSLFEDLVEPPSGIEIKTISCPKEAVEFINKCEDLSIIFCDFRLGPISALEVKSEVINKEIPFYVVSGDTSAFDPSSFSGVYNKPINYDEISQKLESL